MTISETVGAVSDCDAPFYDLQGRRLTEQPKEGVFIKDGRKVVVVLLLKRNLWVRFYC